MTSVKKVDFTFDRDATERDLRSLCLIVRPSWKYQEIAFKKLPGGLINDIYKCSVPSDADEREALIVRIYSTQTVCDIIDRNRELYGMQVANIAGVSEPLYIIFNNGLVYGYAPGELGYWSMLWDEQLARKYMEMLTKFHAVDVSHLSLLNKDGEKVTLTPKIDAFEKLSAAVDDIPQKFVNFPERHKRLESFWPREKIKDEIVMLETFFTKFNFDVVYCHDDAWVWNVIYNKKTGKISLIDFEFANCNYEGKDLAALFGSMQLFQLFNRLLPPSMNTTQDELKLPRTTEHKRKLTKLYMEEKCLRQGKKANDFTEEEFEKFYNQAEILAIFGFFSLSIFLMTQFDDPEVPWDCVSFAEDIFQKYLEQRETLYSYKP